MPFQIQKLSAVATNCVDIPLVAGEQVLTASWRIAAKCFLDLAGLLGVEPQPRADPLEIHLGDGAGQHLEPLLNQKRLLRAEANASQLGGAIGMGSGALRPEPGSSLRAEHVDHRAGDVPLTAGIEQVVNRKQLAGGHPEPQHRRGLAVGARCRPVGNNLGLGGQKMAEFGDLVFQESRFRWPGREGQLHITPARSAIWGEAAVSEQQTEQASDVDGVQCFSL